MTDPPARKSAPPLTSLNRALDVLEALAGDEASRSLTALTAELGMAKPTVRRLLINLMARGYVGQDEETREYRLGLRCWDLGTAAVRSLDVQVHARDQIREIAMRTGEQSAMWVYDDAHAVCVDRVESQRRIRVHTQLGSREPVMLLAAGRCLLSAQPAAEVERVLSSAVEASVITEEALPHLRDRLALIGRRRFDTSMGDRWQGVSAAAAPVRDHRDVTVAAIGIAGSSSQLPAERLEELALLLRDAADLLSGRVTSPPTPEV